MFEKIQTNCADAGHFGKLTHQLTDENSMLSFLNKDVKKLAEVEQEAR